MSLLMEALKRAEESKRLAEGHVAEDASATSSTETTPHPSDPQRNPLPDLAQYSDSVNAGLATSADNIPLRRASAPSRNPSNTSARELPDRAAARNVFAAKKTSDKPNGLWLFLGLSGIVGVAFCAYFWWQLQAASGGSLSQPVPALPSAQTAAPALPATNTPVSGSSTQAIIETKPAAPELPAEPVASAWRPARQVSAAADPAPAPRKSSPTTEPVVPDTTVRLDRSPPKPNPNLENAYDALQSGRLDEARRGYEMVLRDDAKNIDALLGLATLAAHRGQAEWAEAYYLRALESDPNDATAQAGLINLRGTSNPGGAESRLKTALASQPDSSTLYFALGNIYARQERWSEAQQAYFRAYSNEPGNADFIFNLAVSLDHLHQNKLATQYYQMALDTTGSANAAFDKNQAKARLLELQP